MSNTDTSHLHRFYEWNSREDMFRDVHTLLLPHPSWAAGVTDKLWSVDDIASLVDAAAPKPGPRGPYKKLEVA